MTFSPPGETPLSAISLLFGLGVALGLGWTAWKAPVKNASILVDAGVWALLGGLAGGRVVFVTINWSYYQHYPQETWQVWQGGFSGPGMLLGGLLSLALFAFLERLPLAGLSDGLLPLLTTLSVAAWLGCWLEGCAYGPPAPWGFPARDEWGIMQNRWPVQLIGALLALEWFWLLELLDWKLPAPGLAASLGLAGLAVQILIVAALRDDPARLWYGLRWEAWGGLVILAISLVALWISHRKHFVR